MRAINFRGRFRSDATLSRRREDFWVYGFYIFQEGTHWIKNGRTTYTVIEGSVGQYTGLLDKNGTEMYEGDIVDILDLTTRREPIRGVIEWNNSVTGFGAEYSSRNYGLYLHDIGGGMPPDRTIEIVGNAYEHSEMVELPAKGTAAASATLPPESRGRKIRA